MPRVVYESFVGGYHGNVFIVKLLSSAVMLVSIDGE